MSMNSPDANDPLCDLLGEPPRSPPGRLSDEPRYRALRSEIDRAQEMTGAPTDWAQVEELGRALLREGYEDLLVAAYTARAAQESAPVAGVRLGLALFVELLGARWTSVSPPEKRIRARVSAFRWWVRASAEALRGASTEVIHTSQGGPGELDELDELETTLAKLGEITKSRLGDSAPALGTLRRELRRLSPTSPPAAPATETPQACQQPPSDDLGFRPDPSPQATSDVAASVASEQDLQGRAELAPSASDRPSESSQDTDPNVRSSPLGDDHDLQREIRRLGDRLIETGERLRGEDLRDPRAYDLLRHGLWLHLTALPPVVAGRTAVVSAPASAQRQLAALRAGERWDATIDLAERLVVRHRLDLDLQRTTAQSLLRLTPPAEEAAAAVLARAREFVAKFPGALDLKSREGTALADGETRAWLLSPPPPLSAARQTVETGAPALGAPTPRPPSAADERQARESAPTHGGDEPSFIDRLERAEEALRGGHRGLASALFSGLETTVDHHDLDRWRPDLAVRVFAGALRCGTDPADSASPQARRLGALSPQILAGILVPAG